MKRLRTSKVKLTLVRFLLRLEHKILLPERTFEWFSASQLNTWTFLRQDRRWRASTERNVNEGKRFDEELFEVTLLHQPPFSFSFIPKHNKYITDLDVKQQNEVVIVQTSPQVQISNHFISSVWVFLWFLHVRIIRTTNPISRLCSDPFVCVRGLKLIVRFTELSELCLRTSSVSKTQIRDKKRFVGSVRTSKDHTARRAGRKMCWLVCCFAEMENFASNNWMKTKLALVLKVKQKRIDFCEPSSACIKEQTVEKLFCFISWTDRVLTRLTTERLICPTTGDTNVTAASI